jgi:hypothetical protein
LPQRHRGTEINEVTAREIGFLINFNSGLLKQGIKRVIL